MYRIRSFARIKKTIGSVLRVVLTLGMTAGMTVANAGAFSVTPVRIFFDQRDRAIAVTLVNEGDTEIALQADINSWIQDANGVDKLELTEDLIVAPPTIKLAPRARQVVRLALTAPRDPRRQMTYRLIVREVPEATAPKDANVQLPIALVLSMPVFITPPTAKRAVNVSLEQAGSSLEMMIANTGSAYSQIRNVELRRAGKVVATFDGSSYILPGSRKRVSLKLDGAGDQARPASGPAEALVIFDDGKPETFAVTVP